MRCSSTTRTPTIPSAARQTACSRLDWWRWSANDSRPSGLTSQPTADTHLHQRGLAPGGVLALSLSAASLARHSQYATPHANPRASTHKRERPSHSKQKETRSAATNGSKRVTTGVGFGAASARDMTHGCLRLRQIGCTYRTLSNAARHM